MFFIDKPAAGCYTCFEYNYVNQRRGDTPPPVFACPRILTESEENGMKLLRRGTALLLSFAIVLGLVGSGFLIRAIAETAMEWYNAKYDNLSRYYEIGNSSDGPGCIATTPGDPGGKSYGLYMFASKAGTPVEFARWCQNSTDSSVYRDIGNQLMYAYSNPSPGYGTRFDAKWREMYQTYGDTFGAAQYDYTKAKFYDSLVSAVESRVAGFKIDNYSVALKNVFWSRAVQHGVSDACSLIQRAFTNLGGFANQPEGQLIQAIYDESGRLVTAEQLYSENGRSGDAMSGDDANKYGTAGKILRYYYGCSSGVQMGVYTRLRVREPADALVMRMNNKSDSLAEGSYQILLNRDNQHLALDAAGGKAALNAKNAENGIQTFTLTHYEGGFYTLSVTVNGSTLRLAASQGAVILAKPDTSDSQKWVTEDGASGRLLKNVGTGTYLSYQNDTLVMAAPTEEAPASAWYLSPVTASAADWRVEGIIYPTKDNILVAKNSSFPVRGVISCSAPITSVKMTVTTKSGAVAINATASPNATSYDLMKLDNSVAYSALAAGDYVFTLTAAAGGSAVELAKSEFTVRQNSGQTHDDETYTVTFDPNGGTLNGSATKTVKLSDIIYGKLPTASKEGYSFIGWFTEKTGGEQIMSGNKIVASDLTLYAQYADVYTYTFLDADGDIYLRGTVAEGELIPAPATPPIKAPDSQYSYSFKGWEGYTAGVTVMQAKNMVFTPQYDAVPLDDEYYAMVLVPGVDAGALLQQLGSGAVMYNGNTKVTSGNIGTGMTLTYQGVTFVMAVRGDINGDGIVTITDVVAIQSHVVGKKTLEDVYELAADINQDGKVSITDVVKAARVVVGKDTIG